MIWWMWFGQLGTYIKGKKVVDLVFKEFWVSNDKGLFLLTKPIFRSICNWERRGGNPHVVYTLL